MSALTLMNAVLAGFFACAAIHYTLYWAFSRRERVLLVFSVLCVALTALCTTLISYLTARTIAQAQTALDGIITFGILVHVVFLQFYVQLGGRRDRAFRILVTGALAFFVILNQWAPLRGTILELRTMVLPGGATALQSIRTPPGASLAFLYVLTLVIQGYGFFVAGATWKRDRAGAILLASGATMVTAGIAIAMLVDFAKFRAPYPGAVPNAIFVLCVALHLSRTYAARGTRVANTERQFEAVFEHSPVGKALLATDGRFLRVNRTFCRIVDSTAQEICTRQLCQIFHDDDRRSIEAESGRLLRGEARTYAVEKQLLRKTGAPSWVRLVVSIVPDERGRPLQMVAQIQDVTEVRAYRESLEELVATRTIEVRAAKDQAERASQAKSWFLTHMSHEIRSPLQVMLLNTAILETDPVLGPEQLISVDSIQASGEHLAALINNVLEMSTVEAGRLVLVESPFDVGVTVEEVTQMLAAHAAANRTDLKIELAPGLPGALLADGGKVKQILINLLSNAIKFTREGSIRVAATWTAMDEAEALVQIVVADTGKGITQQDQARLFQPFEQLGGGAGGTGTGLGLTISLAYARLMGGDIGVKSQLGIGSQFTLTFPARRVSAEQRQGSSESPVSLLPAASTRPKVLIVDDVNAIRDALAALLKKSGFEVGTATDGASALSIHAEWRPDIVLMDLRMPGMDGLEVIRRLRAAGSTAAIGALTAGAFGDDEREASGAGADFFMRKPFNDRELVELLVRILAARGRGDDSQAVSA